MISSSGEGDGEMYDAGMLNRLVWLRNELLCGLVTKTNIKHMLIVYFRTISITNIFNILFTKLKAGNYFVYKWSNISSKN